MITKFENTFLFAAFCNDSLECERYTTENCDNDWMKSNCKKKCGNCEGMLKLRIRTRLWNSESCVLKVELVNPSRSIDLCKKNAKL